MKTFKFRHLAALMVAMASTLAGAQTYPSHSVRVIIPAAPGGAVDTLGRIIANKLTTSLGQPFVVENMPGAGTAIASQYVSTAPADGYTLLMITNSFSINAAVRSNLRYDSERSFIPLTLIATLPDLLLINPGVPAKSVKELIQLAKDQPGKLNFASAGVGSRDHMDAELFRSMAKVDMVHVPYKGGSPAIADLISGQVQMAFSNPINAMQHVRSGKLRLLAVTSEKRSPLLPDVPTVAESGLKGYESDAWYAAVVPAGTPQNVAEILNKAIVSALNSAEVRSRIEAEGGVVVGNSSKEFARFLHEDIARWQAVVKAKPELKVDQ